MSGGLLRDEDDVGATVVRHVGVGSVFLGVDVALGNDFDTSGGNAEGLEVLLGGGSAAVTETEVVLGGTTPVAVTFEEDAVGGVGIEVGFGLLDFGAFAFFDAGAIEVEENGLGTAEEIAVYEKAVGAGREVGAGRQQVLTEVAANAAACNATLTQNGRVWIRPGRFFNAAGEGDDGAEKGER